MRKPLIVPALALAACASTPEPMPAPPPPAVKAEAPMTPLLYPATRAVDVKDTLHGVVVEDPYRWLEQEKEPEVQSWMKAQDALTRGWLAKLPVREELQKRLKELYYVDVLSAPLRRGNRWFFTRRHADKEKVVVYFREGKDGKEQVLLDPNQWSKDGTVSLGTWVPSWDGKSVAFTQKENNSDEATLYVLDVATLKRSEVDVIPGAKYAHPSWTPKGDGFYYTWLPTDPKIPVMDRPGHAEVRFHQLGTKPDADVLVHEKTGDPTKFIGAEVDRDGRWLVLTVSHGWSSTDVKYKDLKAKKPKWIDLAKDQGAIFSVTGHKDRLYVHTNYDAAKWRLLEVDPRKAKPNDPRTWRELVPEDAEATLDGVALVGGHFALGYLRNAAGELAIHSLDGKRVRKVELPGVGSVLGPIGNPEDDEAYYSFESFTTPRHVFAYSVKEGKSSLFSKVELPVDPSPYTVEQVWYTSKDGVRISMFVVHRKDLKKDGTTPTYLTGYGGFLISETPSFNSGIFPWLERGGIFALPNLRGGGEYGEGWHQNGMLLKKQNTFDDFIGAAEFLIKEGYTSPEKLAIAGGSNGGLLVGAAMTQRPELFRAVVCAVPLLDMVRYHLFGSGKTWISEYGSAEDPKQFAAIHAYSPYHHVKPGTRYPALLMDAADADDRVDPMHARKFVAAVQAASTAGPTLLRIEPNAGHGGADLVKQAVTRGADKWAFVLHELGMIPKSAPPVGPAPAAPSASAAPAGAATVPPAR